MTISLLTISFRSNQMSTSLPDNLSPEPHQYKHSRSHFSSYEGWSSQFCNDNSWDRDSGQQSGCTYNDRVTAILSVSESWHSWHWWESRHSCTASFSWPWSALSPWEPARLLAWTPAHQPVCGCDQSLQCRPAWTRHSRTASLHHPRCSPCRPPLGASSRRPAWSTWCGRWFSNLVNL